MPTLETVYPNPVLQAIAERQSIRHFSTRAVDKEDLRLALMAALRAPSGKNLQPWRFMVIMGGDQRQALVAGFSAYGKMFQSAGALIVVFLAKENSYDTVKDYQGMGACLQNLLLALHSQGLGAVWVGEILKNGPRVAEALGLDPAALELQAVVCVGYPEKKPPCSERRPLSDFLLEDF